ncbi:MAG: NnrS family protein [Neisseria sp.]|nr:NnrS family protein [Neisseria sp.]
MNKGFFGKHGFWAYPFRSYFLLAAAVVPLASLAWALAVAGAWPLHAAPLHFHAYAFLNGVGSAAFAGFLFTAIPEWTHDARNLSRHAKATLLLWLAAAGAALVSLQFSAWLMLVFWLYLLWFVGTVSWQARDSRQLSVVLMLLAVAALDAGFALSGDMLWLRQMAHVFIIGILLITFRIGRAIGQKALQQGGRQDCSFMPNPFYRNLSVCMLYGYVAAGLLLPQGAVQAWLSLAVGLAVIGRLRDWHYAVLLKQYYIRWYYLTLLAVGAGYVWQGAAVIAGDGNPLPAFHLIMIGGYLLMLMQVFGIAGAVHSSLPLHYPKSNRISQMLIAAAALSRSAAVAGGADYALFALWLPGILLWLAFWLYIPVYWQIFTNHPPLAVKPARKR